MKPIFALLCFIVFLLAACNSQRGQTIQEIPTAASIEGLATAQVQTAVAPPEGFRDSVSFPQVDANLQLLAGGRYEVTLEFDGVFARTPRQTSANTTAAVWFNQAGGQRRVTVQTSGELLGREDNSFEAVRLDADSFLVQAGTCVTGGEDAKTAANLSAGSLVGGVTHATPAGQKATLNGEEVWKYDFTTTDLNLPAIHVPDDGTLEATSGELWIAPSRNAVVRFYVNLNVTNTIIFDRALPVDGQVIIRYDLYDVGKTTNISVPNGC
ncbi:MAG: hypothetical protein R3E39_11630 [Anaerolineae bacterium]